MHILAEAIPVPSILSFSRSFLKNLMTTQGQGLFLSMTWLPGGRVHTESYWPVGEQCPQVLTYRSRQEHSDCGTDVSKDGHHQSLTPCMHVPTLPLSYPPSPWVWLALWLLWSTECSKSQILRILRSKHKRADSFYFFFLKLIHRKPPLRMQTAREKANLAMPRGQRELRPLQIARSTSSHENEPS